MEPLLRNNELDYDDLLGYTISDIECTLCSGGICGLRSPRIINGNVVMVCPNTEAGRDVLRGFRDTSQPN